MASAVRCSMCPAAAVSEARPKGAAYGERPVPICSEVCLMKHIEAKRRNRGGQDRDDIDTEDRENELDPNEATGPVSTGYGGTIRPAGLDPSVAPAPGVSLALKQYKPRRSDVDEGGENDSQAIEPLGDYQDDADDSWGYAPGTPDFTKPRPEDRANGAGAGAVSASPMYIDLTGDDEEPSFVGPVDGGTIAPASPEDMAPVKKAPIVIDLTDDAQPLPENEEAAVPLVDPLSGEVYLDGPLAVAEERENNEDDDDDGMRTPGPPPMYPAPEPLPSDNLEDFLNARPILEGEPLDEQRLGYRQLYTPSDAIYAAVNNVVMSVIHNWLSTQYYKAKRGLEETCPIAIWMVHTIAEPRNGDPSILRRPTHLVVFVARNKTRDIDLFQQRGNGLGLGPNPFSDLEQMLQQSKALHVLPQDEMDPTQFTKSSVRLIVTYAKEPFSLDLALTHGTEKGDMYKPDPRYPDGRGEITLQNVASFMEEFFLHPSHEFLPSVPNQRIKSPPFSLAFGERAADEEAPSWMFWSAAEASYRKQADNFHWTTANINNPRTKEVPLAQGSLQRRFNEDLGRTSPFSTLLVAALIRGVERNKAHIRAAAIQKDINKIGVKLYYGPTPFHIYDLFTATKQFEPSINGQRARDLRRHYQTYILRVAADTLSKAGYTGNFHEAIYSPSPYLPDMGGLVWHGTQTPQLISGEWVIKDGSFFSFDSEMSARYAAVNRAGLEFGQITPALLCYQIAAPLPKRMIHYRCVPLPVKNPADPSAELAYDLYFTGRIFDLPFWQCFGQIPGYFTPQAETICKVWGTGLVIHMAQSVGIVMEETMPGLTIDDPSHRRKIMKEAHMATMDKTLFCRSGVELVLAHPRRYLRRKLRPAIDAIVTGLYQRRIRDQFYSPGDTSSEDFGRNYGYADILSMLYHKIMNHGWYKNNPLKRIRKPPPFMKYMTESSYMEALPMDWQQIGNVPWATRRVFANVNLTHGESDIGRKYAIPRRVPALSDPEKDRLSPNPDKTVWAFPTCLVVGGATFSKRVEQFKIDEKQQFLMVDVEAVDIAFREALLSFSDEWTIYDTSLENDPEYTPMVQHLIDLLTEGFTYDKTTGVLTHLGAPRPELEPFSNDPIVLMAEEKAARRVRKDYEDSLRRGGNVRHNLLFSFRDYLYLVQAPNFARMGAGNFGVIFDEAPRVYGSENLPPPLSTPTYGISHNDPNASRAVLRSFRGKVPGLELKA